MALKFHSENTSPELSTPGAYIDKALGQRFRAWDKALYKAKVEDKQGKNLGLSPMEAGHQTGRVSTTDYFTNPAARMGWGTESLTEGTQYELVRLSYDYWLMITLYTNHWIARKIVDVPASDIIRAWPRLTSEIEPGDIALIDRAIRKTQTKKNLETALKWSRLFGGAGALIVIDGHEGILDQPLDLETIGIGSYKGVIPFDRWAGIQPSANMSNDINEPTRFNLPEYYECQLPTGGSFKVHASRILRFCGPTVPTPEYEARQEWGVSVIEVCFEEMRKRDNMSWNLLCLSYRANLISMKVPQLAEMLSGAGLNQSSLVNFQQRMQAINAYMNSQNMMLLPKDGEMGSVSYSPSGWDGLYQQFQLDIAGAAGMPVVKLFGRTATGLAQSNDADMQLYYEKIGQEQDTDLRPQLDVLYPVVCMSTLGQVPKDLDLVFPSARVMGEDEKAILAKNIGDLILGAAQAGIIDKAMALRELKQSSDITGIFTNITDDDIEKAEKEVEAGIGTGEMAGMPGMPPGAPSIKSEEKNSTEVNSPGQMFTAPEMKEQESPSKEKIETPNTNINEEEKSSLVKNTTAEKEEDSSGGVRSWANKFRKALSGVKHFSSDSEGVRYISFQDLPIGVEYDAGGRRLLHNDAGEVVYDVLLTHPYGFIQCTTGRDGDEVDVILGEDRKAENVYIVNMIDLGPNIDKREDEDKVCIGFPTQQAAKEAFLSMYPSNFFGGMVKVSLDEFHKMVRRGVI